MKSYILAILTISVVGGIVNSLLPERGKTTKVYVNFIIGLISAILMISPIISSVKNISQLENSLEKYILGTEENAQDTGSIINESKENIKKGIENQIISKFNFKEDDLEVLLDTKESETQMIINKITVVLCNEATWYDEEKIISFLEETVGFSVEIVKK